MKIVIETFVSIFFITVMILVATQLLGTQIQVNAAEEFQNNVVKKIEECNFNNDVIQACKAQAENQGYILTVNVNKESVLNCNECNNQWRMSDSTRCNLCGANNVSIVHLYHDGYITLVYPVESALLGVNETGKIVTYAR